VPDTQESNVNSTSYRILMGSTDVTVDTAIPRYPTSHYLAVCIDPVMRRILGGNVVDAGPDGDPPTMSAGDLKKLIGAPAPRRAVVSIAPLDVSLPPDLVAAPTTKALRRNGRS